MMLAVANTQSAAGVRVSMTLDGAFHRRWLLQACRALVAAGADLLRRNGKNRIPGSQLKVCLVISPYLTV